MSQPGDAGPACSSGCTRSGLGDEGRGDSRRPAVAARGHVAGTACQAGNLDFTLTATAGGVLSRRAA